MTDNVKLIMINEYVVMVSDKSTGKTEEKKKIHTQRKRYELF